MVFIKWLLSYELVNGMVSDLCIFEVVLEALNKCQEKLWFAIILKQQEKYFFTANRLFLQRLLWFLKFFSHNFLFSVS